MSMTKSEIAATLAEQVGITKRQAKAFFEAQAALAYKQAKDQFVIPGIGKLKVAEKARSRDEDDGGPIEGANGPAGEKSETQIPDRPSPRRRRSLGRRNHQ